MLIGTNYDFLELHRMWFTHDIATNFRTIILCVYVYSVLLFTFLLDIAVYLDHTH